MSFQRISIRDQKLIYHITDLENLESILQEGIKPRSELTNFSDIADKEILEKRKHLNLENKVPFHFFVNNPFDGGIVKNNPMTQFIILAVYRSHAKSEGWNIIPKHPLANESLRLMGYDEGMNVIDWNAMNERNYNDANSKSVCMAECLAPGTVLASSICSIFVNTKQCESKVTALLHKHKKMIRVNNSPNMFPKLGLNKCL